MSSLTPVTVAVEGEIDEWIIRRVLTHVGLPVHIVHSRRGKHCILERLNNYNRDAHYTPWLVVVDLDRDVECAPDYVRKCLPNPASGMCFRVAVHAIEAWLLADSEHMAAFLHVPQTKFPKDPDEVLDPKGTIVNLARKSRRKTVREDIVPDEKSGRKVGKGYLGRIREFVCETDTPWRPGVACQHSDSLRRCVAALESLKDWQPTE